MTTSNPEVITKARYVLGFIFDAPARNIALIEKKRPAWQAGLLNGIGGKIEAGETPLQAMERECREECGLTEFVEPFRLFGRMSGPLFVVEMFVARASNLRSARTCTDETVHVLPVAAALRARHTLMPNLAGLISLALEPQSPWLELRYGEAQDEHATAEVQAKAA